MRGIPYLLGTATRRCGARARGVVLRSFSPPRWRPLHRAGPRSRANRKSHRRRRASRTSPADGHEGGGGRPGEPVRLRLHAHIRSRPVSGEQFPAPGTSSTSFSGLVNGVYTVVETTAQPGYTLTASTCRSVAVTLGATSHCTVTNTFQPTPAPATLHVTKVTSAVSSERFDFASSAGRSPSAAAKRSRSPSSRDATSCARTTCPAAGT